MKAYHEPNIQTQIFEDIQDISETGKKKKYLLGESSWFGRKGRKESSV